MCQTGTHGLSPLNNYYQGRGFSWVPVDPIPPSVKYMMNTLGKDTRLVARVDEETQRLIAHAAELTGRSLSQFLIYAAKKEAQEAERQALQIQVSRQSADLMLELLDNPEPINPKLREAALNHRKLAGDFKNRRDQ